MSPTEGVLNRLGFARGWGSGHLAPLGDGVSVLTSRSIGAMWSIDDWILSVLYQRTHSAVSRSTSCSPDQFRPRRCEKCTRSFTGPIVDSINALSSATPTVPIDPAMLASASSSVNASAVYCEPASD